jgi:hypothetical protein
MSRKPFVVVAGLCFAFIAYATLCPIHDRPHFWGAHEPDWVSAFERFAAFLVFGFAARLASPSRPCYVLVIIAAVGLELLQFVIPHRDPRAIDALIKIAGGVLGIMMVHSLAEWWRVVPATTS